MSVRKHQRVWLEATGRELPPGWVIHHLNGNHEDDRPENLAALPKRFHDSLGGTGISFHIGRIRRRAEEAEQMAKLFEELLLDLGAEQRNRGVKSVGGKIWRKGYKRKSGEYTWVETTLDELQLILDTVRKTADSMRKAMSDWEIRTERDFLLKQRRP